MTLHSDSWHKLHCGDRVIRKGDPRHVGRVETIQWSTDVRVTWDPSHDGAKPIRERFNLFERELEVIEHARTKEPLSFGKRPATVVMSPRAKLEQWFQEQRSET